MNAYKLFISGWSDSAWVPSSKKCSCVCIVVCKEMQKNKCLSFLFSCRMCFFLCWFWLFVTCPSVNSLWQVEKDANSRNVKEKNDTVHIDLCSASSHFFYTFKIKFHFIHCAWQRSNVIFTASFSCLYFFVFLNWL